MPAQKTFLRYHIRAIGSQFQKSDKIDARLLCRELKDGRLRGIHVLDIEREHLLIFGTKVKTTLWMVTGLSSFK